MGPNERCSDELIDEMIRTAEPVGWYGLASLAREVRAFRQHARGEGVSDVVVEEPIRFHLINEEERIEALENEFGFTKARALLRRLFYFIDREASCSAFCSADSHIPSCTFLEATSLTREILDLLAD